MGKIEMNMRKRNKPRIQSTCSRQNIHNTINNILRDKLYPSNNNKIKMTMNIKMATEKRAPEIENDG